MAQVDHRTKSEVVLKSWEPYQVNKKIKNIYFFNQGVILGPPKCPIFVKMGISGA